MIPRFRRPMSALALCLVLAATLSGPATAWASDLPPWWELAWQSRLVVATVEPELAGAINTARVVLHQGAKVHQGGQDVRVVDERLQPVRHAVTPLEDGGIAVEFCVENATGHRYCVYFDNPDAPADPHKWDRRVGGLYLETRDASSWRRNANTCALFVWKIWVFY